MAVAAENNQSVPGGYAIKNQQYYKEMGMRRDGEEMLQTRSTELQIRIAKECCLLYDGAESACWACGPGWDGPLEKLSYKLEALNVQLFDRWKVRVIAAQVKEKFGTLRFYFDCLVDGNGEPTREQLVLSRYVEDLASEYVRKAEEECYGVCEECGTSIGSSESPRCCTLGWCRYLCRDCAMRHEEGFPPVRYEMDGKFYEGEKEIPSPFRSKDFSGSDPSDTVK